MANTFFSRLQLKYDTLANWNTNKSVVLLKGEIGICEVPTGGTAVNGDPIRPQILFKVGDGVIVDGVITGTTWENLPWASAKAADVYDWAKQANLPIERSASETGAEGNVISSVSWDSTNKKIVYTTATVATSEGLAQLTNRVKNLEDTYATSESLTNAVNAINEAVAKKADKTYVDDELAKKANQSDFEALKSKVEDEDGALAKANENAENITKIVNGTTPVAKATDADKLGNVVASDYALKTNAQGYANAVLGVEGDAVGTATVHGALKTAQKAQNELDAFLKGTAEAESAIDTLVEIQEYITGDVQAFTGLSQKVSSIEDGTFTEAMKSTVATVKVSNAGQADNADKLGNFEASNYLLKSDATGYADILTKTEAGTTYEPIGAESRANAYADGLAGNYATSAQGALADTAVQPGDLAAIATSGLISDLTQTANTYIVINCGSSSSVI